MGKKNRRQKFQGLPAPLKKAIELRLRNPKALTLAELLEAFGQANQTNDIKRKMELYQTFPAIALMDFKDVLIRAFGQVWATEVEAKLHWSLGMEVDPTAPDLANLPPAPTEDPSGERK